MDERFGQYRLKLFRRYCIDAYYFKFKNMIYSLKSICVNKYSLYVRFCLTGCLYKVNSYSISLLKKYVKTKDTDNLIDGTVMNAIALSTDYNILKDMFIDIDTLISHSL